MERSLTDSSNIRAVGYDPDSRELHVEFVSGKVYSYADVEPEVYDDFMAHPSKGSFFARAIRGHYVHSSVEESS